MQLVTPPVSEAIRLRLCASVGYIEGQTIATQSTDMRRGSAIGAPELVAELVRLKVDIHRVIVGGGWLNPSGHECDQDDSHRYGERRGRSCRKQVSLKALPGPGGNVTGLSSTFHGELGGKRLELLKGSR